MREIEMENGGCLQFDGDGQFGEDFVIRYIDEHGNVENIWRPGDEGYEDKLDLFEEE